MKIVIFKMLKNAFWNIFGVATVPLKFRVQKLAIGQQ